MTITVGSSTATGTYPITATGIGEAVQQNATVTLMVMLQGTDAIIADGCCVERSSNARTSDISKLSAVRGCFRKRFGRAWCCGE